MRQPLEARTPALAPVASSEFAPSSQLASTFDPSGIQPDEKPNHAQRGLHAAILAVHDAVQLGQLVAGRPEFSGLPMLTLACGVHLGVAELSRRSSGKVHAAGEA